MNLGFTGTRLGLSTDQTISLVALLIQYKPEQVRHGMCPGADEHFHKLTRLVLPDTIIVGHPPLLERYVMQLEKDLGSACDVYEDRKASVSRDKEIIKRVDLLIAAPLQNNPDATSPIWIAIRFADEMKKPIIILNRNDGLQFKNIKRL